MMTSKQRMLCALTGKKPDRLPVTTHHVMPWYLKHRLGGISNQEFFDRFGLDAIHWAMAYRPDESRGEYAEAVPEQFLQSSRLISSARWRIVEEPIPGQEYPTTRHRIVTPKGDLTVVLQSNDQTTWCIEHLIKEKRDIELIGEFGTLPLCDTAAINRAADSFGERGIVRGHVCCFDVFGQPGTWQDAACLVGIQELIMATYDDPKWVHELLGILQRRKLAWVRSLKGAAYDLVEFGGGDASSTVISPSIFDEFVAPYDAPVIAAAHEAGQRIVYHTCGGMMPFLERIAEMKPDAMETFTPAAMGGDTRLAEARRRVGEGMCMIGGFDQFHFFVGCTPEQTRAEVRRCFEEAGQGGRLMLSPSDHFFEADPKLLEAYADEARKCGYQ